jgi:hypothetical protein
VVSGADDEEFLGSVDVVTLGRDTVGMTPDPGRGRLVGSGEEEGRRDRGVGRGKLKEVVYRSMLEYVDWWFG